MPVHPIAIIHTANTETQSPVGHVPKERFKRLSRGIRHAVRPQLAQYENTIGRLEWIIDRHHAVIVGVVINQSAAEYGKLCSSNPHIHVAELFGEEPELLTRTVVPSVDPDVRAVFACLRVLDVEHESVFVCDCPIGFHPRAGKPYRLRRLPADQEYRRANRVDLVYGKLLLHVEDVDGNGNAIAQLRTACVPCDNLESCCRMTVRDHRDVVERWNFVLIVVHQLQFDGIRIPVRSF